MLNHDARFRDEVSEEGAHLTHLAEEHDCAGDCGATVTRDTVDAQETEEGVYCPACATLLALAFVDGVFAPSSARVSL